MASSRPSYKRRNRRGRRAGHQKRLTLTDETSVIERALRSLCQNDGKLSLEYLAKKVGQFDPGLGSLEEIISDFHDVHFRIIDYADSSVFVEAHTPAKICHSYLKKECEEGDACQNLHLCGYFATGSCCWFGVNCRKSHEFRSDHNKQVLKQLDIAFLPNQCLKILFRLAWPHFTIPEFCGLYRSQHGCKKQSCRFLHICKNFVMKECTYGPRCKFAHDIYAEASNLRLLKRFNISLEYSSDDLLRLIRERNEGYYRPDLQVFESDGKDSDGEECDEEPSCTSNIYETMKFPAYDNNFVSVPSKISLSSTKQRPNVAGTRESEINSILPKKTKETSVHLMEFPTKIERVVKTNSDSKCLDVMSQLPAKPQTHSKHMLNLNNSQTGEMQNKKKGSCKDNPNFPIKLEPKLAVQTTSASKCHAVIVQFPAKPQTQSNDLLDFNNPQTMAMQDKKKEIRKDSPHVTAKHEPKATVQTSSPSKCHVVMAQLPVNSQTQFNDLLDLNISQTGKMQDKKKKVCKDSPHVTAKHEPKVTVQTTSHSKCHVVMAQLPAKCQTQSNDLLDLKISQTGTMQDKEKKVCKDNPNSSTKLEPKPTVQTTSAFNCHTVMENHPVKSQTRSKHFNNPQTREMQDKKEDICKDSSKFPTKLEPKHIKQIPSAPEGAKLPAKSQIQSKHFLDFQNPQTVALQSKKAEICKDNLRGSCTSGTLCQRHHCDLPYQWQVKNNGIWESVDSFKNNTMEKEYCDMKANLPVCLAFDTWGCMLIFYDGMYISNPGLSLIRDIRRLEIKGEPDFSDSHLNPHWSWYWKDECGTWIEYAEQNIKQNARSDKESSDFETLYDDYKNQNGSQTVKFKAGNQHYTLNFASMTQTNDQYGTQKAVRQRPSRYITLADVKRYREEKPWLNKNKYPETWNMNLRVKSHLLVKVSKHKDSEEYKKIQKMFQTTLPGVNITKIERVQNETCWDLFSRQKEVMMKKNPSKPVHERLLFHGTTPEKVEDICRDNFDFRLSGTRVGAAYGQGAYFASTSKYSDAYAEADGYSIKKMFVARVLVGSYTTGTRDMRRPPYKNSSDKTKGMYDSCVDNTSNPSIFVVFDNHQVYPEYLITYSTSSANQTSYSNNQPSSYNPSTSTTARSSYSAWPTSYTSTSQRNSYNPSTSTTARSAYSANQTSYSSTSQQNSYNPFTSTTPRSAYSANQTSYSSTSQQNSYNPSTSTTPRSAYSANQTSYSSTSQQNSYNPSTSTTARSAYSANQTSYSSTSQRNSYNPFTSTTARNASSSTSSSRNTKSSCVCM